MRKIFLILSMMFALHAVSVEAQTSSEDTLVIDEMELFSDTTSLEEGWEDPMEDDDYYDGYINEDTQPPMMLSDLFDQILSMAGIVATIVFVVVVILLVLPIVMLVLLIWLWHQNRQLKQRILFLEMQLRATSRRSSSEPQTPCDD